MLFQFDYDSSNFRCVNHSQIRPKNQSVLRNEVKFLAQWNNGILLYGSNSRIYYADTTLCRAIPQCWLETLGAWLVVNSVTRDSVFVIICMFNGLYPNLQCILNFISHVQVIFQSYITTCMGKTWSLAIYHILKRSLDQKYAISRTWCTTTLTAVLLQTLITQFRQLIKVGFPLVYSLPGDNLWIIWISQ